MELWLEAEIRIRRDNALENARWRRSARLARSGRSPGARIRLADGAQAVSEALAVLARNLRNGEAA
jgi:hypothetical protein